MIEHFALAHLDFKVIHLTFDTIDYLGSLNVYAKHVAYKDKEELNVVGGIRSFVFARGLVVFAQTNP